MPQIIQAETAAHVEILRQLFREYANSLDTDLCFQSFEEELRRLPESYTGLYLALEGETPAGCAGLRRLSGNAGELKRLYVRPAYRGLGLGRQLVQAAIENARQLGYERLRLDTLPSMTRALQLYRSLGFTPIAAYDRNPVPDATFWELNLR